MHATGYDQYRTQAATTASPAQLVLMLFDGAIAEITRAERGLTASPADLTDAHDCLSRAQAIVTQLSVTLDRDRGGAIASGLSSLYTFCLEQLVDANVRKSADPLGATAKILADLREAWQVACCTGALAGRVPAGATG